MASEASLLEKIQSGDPNVRTEAWLSAGEVGAPALKPLAKLAAEGQLEVSRAAQRAMWKIVRHSGRPAAPAPEKQQVIKELNELLSDAQPVAIRREVLWMLSEIAGDESVERIAALLGNQELREDARMVLDRIPGDKSLAALKAALEKAATTSSMPWRNRCVAAAWQPRGSRARSSCPRGRPK
jgi:hypothetical protein